MLSYSWFLTCDQRTGSISGRGQESVLFCAAVISIPAQVLT